MTNIEGIWEDTDFNVDYGQTKCFYVPTPSVIAAYAGKAGALIYWHMLGPIICHYNHSNIAFIELCLGGQV